MLKEGNMKDKVKDYIDRYSQLEQLYKEKEIYNEPIAELENELADLTEELEENDYRNPQIVIDNIQEMIDTVPDDIAKTVGEMISEEYDELIDTNSRVRKNVDKVGKWFGRKKVEKLLQKQKDIAEDADDIDLDRAKEMKEFSIMSVFNKIIAVIFRFDFLKCFPKVIRAALGSIFWVVFFFVTTLKHIYNSINTSIYATSNGYYTYVQQDDYLMMQQAFEYMRAAIIKQLICGFVLPVAALILISIVVYAIADYYAKKYLLDNQMIYRVILYPDKEKQNLYNYRCEKLISGIVHLLEEEIKHIKENGLSESGTTVNWGERTCDSIISELKEEYEDIQAEIIEKKNELERKKKEAEVDKNITADIVEELKTKEKEFDVIITDESYNNAVISPYINLGFVENELTKAKKLLAYKNNMKPMVIYYDEETECDGDLFRKESEYLIEKLMEGFYRENYHGILNLSLVDFEGLHFPESRTKGLMKIIRNQTELELLYEELRQTRNNVDLLMDGNISTINPQRLINRENPINYNIVFFMGVDFTSMDKELSQLFIMGEYFGFMPIIFMNGYIAENIMQDEFKSDNFKKILKKAADNNQQYDFENIMQELKYEQN